MCTHEQFVHAVRTAALTVAADLTDAERSKLAGVKMVYGRGTHGLRGLTAYGAWKHAGHDHNAHTTGTDDKGHEIDLIEICALGEESWVQLAGTTLHELGHSLAGWTAGHDKDWKAACARLGLRRVHAAGTQYLLANFTPVLRLALEALPKPSDGTPSNGVHGSIRHTKKGTARVCSAGIGTKGGKSRGVGSGSRLRKYVCSHGQIIRASTDDLQATCNVCNQPFMLEEKQASTLSGIIGAMLTAATQEV